jgi:hypothetical protein
MLIAWNATDYDYIEDELNQKQNLLSRNIFLESYNFCISRENNENVELSKLYYFIPLIPVLIYYLIKKS